MFDYSELKRLAEAATPDDASPYLPCPVAFTNAATPAAVLALIAENETIKAQFDECARLFVDAAEQACKAQRERDQLKTENERLRACTESIYRAAWDESGEGWNAEYPGDVHCKPEWNERMKQTIDGIMSEGEQSSD